MKDTCIVDGYNVIFARWVRSPASDQDLAQGRRLLVDHASRFAQRRGIRTAVVFDGARPPGEVAGGRARGVRVVWSGAERSADQMIVALVERARGHAMVVSGDRSGVVDEVSRRGAAVLPPAEFLRVTEQPSPAASLDEKPGHASRADVQYWLDRFREGEDGNLPIERPRRNR
jgi:predicted RNA-binding protein with PIN domain